MPQLNFAQNVNYTPAASMVINQGSLTFFRFSPTDSISWNTLNMALTISAANLFTLTFSVGLYSLNGSTLSLANSVSATRADALASEGFWQSMIATSATQNITPGTWWIAPLVTADVLLGGAITLGFQANSNANPANAFPGGFLQGAMSASTAALPTSIATSDLDVTGGDALTGAAIIITA